MIQKIENKYCIGDLVQLMPYTDHCHLLLSSDEIILFKIGDNILVNKYRNHPQRPLFPFHEREQDDMWHFTELFEYDKSYVNFRMSVSGYSAIQTYLLRAGDSTYHVDESLSIDERNIDKRTLELSRQEIESIFCAENYDSMFVFDMLGTFLFARSKKDHISIGEKVIPTDEEIVARELRERTDIKPLSQIMNIRGVMNGSSQNYSQPAQPKTIDEIKDFNIYGTCSLMRDYNHMLLTIKDGEFALQWFKIDLIEKDRFRLTYSPIAITAPTMDNVRRYASRYGISEAPKPMQELFPASDEKTVERSSEGQKLSYQMKQKDK